MFPKHLTAVALAALLASATALPQTPSPSANTQPSTNLCGNDEHIILDGTPWLVANSMYGAAAMVGSLCTYYNRIETSSSGNPRVVWSSTTAIQDIESTLVATPVLWADLMGGGCAECVM